MRNARYALRVACLMAALTLFLAIAVPILGDSGETPLLPATFSRLLTGTLLFQDGSQQQTAQSTAATFVVCASNANNPGRCDFRADGVADQSEINQALDACPPIGCEVKLSEGTFWVNGPVLIRKPNVRLTGSGRTTKLFLADGANSDVLVVDSIGARDSLHGITLDHFTCDGNRSRNQTGHCIRLNGNADYTVYSSIIRDVSLNYAPLSGFYADFVSEIQLVDFEAGWNLTGVEFRRASESKVQGIISMGQQDGLLVADSSDFDIDVHAEFLTRHGIYLKNTDLSDVNFVVYHNGGHGVLLEGSDYNTLRGVTRGNSRDGDGLYDGILLQDSSHNIIKGVQSHGEGANLRHRYGIGEAGSADYNRIESNNIQHAVASVLRVGPNSTVRGNTGYTTESSGTATIPAGATSVQISHGLAVAPSPRHCSVTPTNSLGQATKFWANDFGPSGFTIYVDSDPGASPATFAWSCTVY